MATTLPTRVHRIYFGEAERRRQLIDRLRERFLLRAKLLPADTMLAMAEALDRHLDGSQPLAENPLLPSEWQDWVAELMESMAVAVEEPLLWPEELPPPPDKSSELNRGVDESEDRLAAAGANFVRLLARCV